MGSLMAAGGAILVIVVLMLAVVGIWQLRSGGYLRGHYRR